jgi:hypothetical protein
MMQLSPEPSVAPPQVLAGLGWIWKLAELHVVTPAHEMLPLLTVIGALPVLISWMS